ncbi:MAG: acyl-CoA dehydratase activase [Desulfotomaculales bacterium]
MVFAGIDVGSLSAEAVLVRNGTMLAYSILPTGANSRGAAERALEEALNKAGLGRDDVAAAVATGYGRINVPFATRRITEISCHARGVAHLFPDSRTIIDIGGQDSKVIRTGPAGKVLDFAMNDKCAAGTGRFLEVMARALELELGELGKLALEAGQAAVISSMCTVFAESEVVSLIAQGVPRDQIARGLCNAIAERIVNLVHRVGLERQLVMTGGVAKNAGVVRAIEDKLGKRLLVPPEPQITGALGAALLAEEAASANVR